MILSVEEIIKEIDDIDVLIKEYTDFICHHSSTPDKTKFPYPKLGTVINENESVRWNREEVDRLRAAYEEESKRLKSIKSDLYSAYDTQLLVLLSEESELSLAKTKCIYSYAYRESHDSGVGCVVSTFRELAELVSDLDKCEEIENNQDEELSR